MNRFEIVALCAAIGITLLSGHEVLVVIHLYLGDASASKWAIWIVGEILLTYGPIATAALCWRWSRRSRLRGLPHLLFLPCAFLLFWAGLSLLQSQVTIKDFDDTLGAPIMPGTFLFLIAIGIYVAALMNLVIERSGQEEAE